jgi:hypothetical protein
VQDGKRYDKKEFGSVDSVSVPTTLIFILISLELNSYNPVLGIQSKNQTFKLAARL